MKKKFILFFGAIFCIGIYLCYNWYKGLTDKIFVSSPVTVEKQNTPESPKTIADKLKQKIPFNMLLIGYGGSQHDGTFLTDTIMLANVNPKDKKIYLISIPRDLFIKLPENDTGGVYRKINHAYTIGLDDKKYPNKPALYKGEAGGGKLAEYAVSQVTGVDIGHFVGIDFAGFMKTIDTLGGIDVTVEKAFDDFSYPVKGKEADPCGKTEEEIKTFTSTASASLTAELEFFPCRYEHLHFDAGIQHMDGETALKFVRSRHSAQDGSDFGRATRQRNVVIAVKDKIFSLGFIPKILPFITSLGDDVRTDLTPEDVRTLLANAQDLNSYKIESQALTDDNFLMLDFSDDGQSILRPRAGQDNYEAIHTWIQDTLSGKPQPVEAVVQVQNGTTKSGLGGQATAALRNMGINTLTPVTVTPANIEKTIIIVLDQSVNVEQLNQLKKLFNVTTTQIGINNNKQQFNVKVILGKDYVPKL